MSDLQIGLAILGLFIVAGVVAFNAWQERKFRQRAEQGFPRPQEDMLLGGGPVPAVPEPREPTADRREPAPRIEPQWEAQPTAPPAPAPAPRPLVPISPNLPNAGIDYVAEIRAGAVISSPSIAELSAALSQAGKPALLAGYDYHAKVWEPVSDGDHSFTSLQAGLQLADRNGSVTQDQVHAFQSTLRMHAGRISAIADLPDAQAALTRASELYSFCTDVDVVIGINVIAHTGQVFHATQIRALAEAQGMKLQPTGGFVCPDGHGGSLFTLDNQEPPSFHAEQIRQVTTPGITFILDVPRTPDGMSAFDRMVATSRKFSESLDGLLADDNRQLLSDAGLDKIRAQLRGIYSAMEAKGISPGSPSALRLFS